MACYKNKTNSSLPIKLSTGETVYVPPLGMLTTEPRYDSSKDIENAIKIGVLVPVKMAEAVPTRNKAILDKSSAFRLNSGKIIKVVSTTPIVETKKATVPAKVQKSTPVVATSAVALVTSEVTKNVESVGASPKTDITG